MPNEPILQNSLKPWQVAGAEALYARAKEISALMDPDWEGIGQANLPSAAFATPRPADAKTVRWLSEWAEGWLVASMPAELKTDAALRSLIGECRALARFIRDEQEGRLR